MLDLANILKQGDSGTQASLPPQQVTCFYQTSECKALVTEAFNFDGLSLPDFHELKVEELRTLSNNEEIEVIILELNASENVFEEAEKYSHYLPNQASVIVIGQEDSINTIRNLKVLGFYYLFWPASKTEFLDFVKSVQDNRTRAAGISKSRKAKQVTFVGCKGGVGTTMLCAETATLFATERQVNSVVVDNAYRGGNVDIMLGIDDFEKRDVRPGSMAVNLDEGAAQSLMRKHGPMLSVLSLTSTDLANTDLKDYTKTVAGYVSQTTNFIFEDVSSSASMIYSSRDLVEISDSIILVFSASVSALREAVTMKKKFESVIDTNSHIRIITVMNYTMPENCASITVEEAQRHLDAKVDIVVPYVKKIDHQILAGKRVINQKNKASKAIRQLASQILGEEKKRGFLSRR